jgi:hypothetical protein
MRKALLTKLYGVKCENSSAESQTTKKVQELTKNVHLNGIGGPWKILTSSRAVEEWISSTLNDERNWYVADSW